jgi:hypothetical protein
MKNIDENCSHFQLLEVLAESRSQRLDSLDHGLMGPNRDRFREYIVEVVLLSAEQLCYPGIDFKP